MAATDDHLYDRISDLNSELDWERDRASHLADALESAKAEAAEWLARAAEMTGTSANHILENRDLKEEAKLLKARLAFFEDGLEQLRKLFKPSGNNVKPVNAHEFSKTVYRRIVKTIGEAPSADLNHRLYPPDFEV